MMFDAIIYDLDGTLVDSETVWAQAEGDLIAARGGVYTKAIRDQVLGLRLDEFFEKLRAIYHFQDSTPVLVTELIERMLALIPAHTRPMLGAEALVRHVATAGHPCAIASASPQAIIEALVASQNWSEAIPLRVSADSVANGKPAPDVYLHTAQLLGVAPARCLAIEDTPTGSRAAVAAGMTCYVVCDPAHTHPTLFEGITPYVYNSLQAVLSQIKD